MKVKINYYKQKKLLVFMCDEDGVSLERFEKAVRNYVQINYSEPYSLAISYLSDGKLPIIIVVFDVNNDVVKHIVKDL